MSISKKNLLSLAFFALFATACDKEELDFGSDTYFGIEAVLNSANCDAECGATAACEGKTIKLKGALDASNINADDHQFYLIDEDKDKYRLEVKVDETISTEVFQKLAGNGGKAFRVEGQIEGYDASTNATCMRQFLLQIKEVNKVEME